MSFASMMIKSKIIIVLCCLATSGLAGPLAGGQTSEVSESTQSTEPKDQATLSTSQKDVEEQSVTLRSTNLASTFVDSMRQEVLPSFESPLLDANETMNLNGLEGWSLEDISEAMSQIADGDLVGPDSNVGNGTSVNMNDLLLDAEDLYTFNAGYYFVLNQQSVGSQNQVVSGPNTPEIVGISALGDMDFNIVLPNTSEIGGLIGDQAAMFDGAFFETVSKSATETRISNTNSAIRGFGVGRQGDRSSGQRTRTSEEVPTLAEVIQNTFDAIIENWFNITVIVMSVGGLAFVVNRIGT